MRNVALKLIGINLVLFLLQLLVPGFTERFFLVGSLLASEPWRVVTSMFLHSPESFFHIFFNMYALLMFGPLIEQKMGSKRFLLFYMLSGIFAGLVFGIVNPNSPALGASGAIMGVIGMTIVLLPHLKVLFFFIIPMSMRTLGILLATIDIFGLVNPSSGVANLAHLVGLCAGLVFGLYLLKQKKQFAENFTRTKRNPSSSNPNDVIIELNEDDVNEYLKNGRL